MKKYERRATLINRNFIHFLLPSVLSTVAISLNEFVDSIIVSRLLGSNAMSMVNMGCPAMLLFEMTSVLLGIGGSVVYAEFLGREENDKADRVSGNVMVTAILAGIILTVIGLVFVTPLSHLLCRDSSFLKDFVPYLRILIISGTIIVPLQVLILFFPAMGKPGIGTAINITANAVNLAFDYIYIHYFNTGLKGAALATLTGYLVGLILAVVLILLYKLKVKFHILTLEDIKGLGEVSLRGAAPALNQMGFLIRFTFLNNLSISLAGAVGIGVFTLCMQTVSIVSVLLGGVISAMTPIAAALYGQGDNKGLGFLMRTVVLLQFVLNALMVLIIELFPGIILVIYDVDSYLVEPATDALRIFSIMFLFRGFVVVFMYYFQVVSRKVYAIVLGLIDGFVGIIPLSLILTSFMGVTGIWVAFPLLSFLMLIGIVIVNLVILRRSQGRYRGIFLIKNEESDIPTYDATVSLNSDDIAENAKQLQDFCRDHGLDGKPAMFVAVASEEMCTNLINSTQKKTQDVTDILVKIYKDEIVMDVRSIGEVFDVTGAEGEEFSSIDVLRKVTSSIEYAYVVGMNQTRIRIAGRARPKGELNPV